MPQKRGATEQSGRRPAKQRPITPPSVRRWGTTSFVGLTPARLASILTSAKRGEVEDWADLCQHMPRTDPHLRACLDTRTLAVAGADWQLEPGRGDGSEADDAQAEAAAEFVRWAFERQAGTQLEDWWAHLLFAEWSGWSGGQQWYVPATYRGRMCWLPAVQAVAPRDFEFRSDWRARVRSYRDGLAQEWQDAEELPPYAVVLHTPNGNADNPLRSGDAHACVWAWLFKHEAERGRAISLERLANPFLYGVTPPNSPDGVRDDLFDGLANLASDHIGIFESLPDGSDPVRLLEASKEPGTTHEQAIRHYDEQVSKALLGSTMAMEATDKGARSLGEAIADTAMMPRLMAHARRLAATEEEQRVHPLLSINAHLFGGRVPPIPQLTFTLSAEEPPEVDQLLIDAGAVTVDELRTSRGLEPLGPERGGDRFVQPLAKTAPQFDRAPATPSAPEVASPAPFGRRQGTLPLTSRRRTGGTSGRSRTTPLDNVPELK